MRARGVGNKTIHWHVSEKDKAGNIVCTHEFTTAKAVADFLNVKRDFIYDYTSPRKKYNESTTTFITGTGKEVTRRGKYRDFFKKYKVERLK